METLLAEIEQLTTEIATELARGNFSDADRKAETLSQKIAQVDELKKQELVTTVTAEVADPDSTFVISAEGFEADFRALAAGEDEYQMLSITTKLYIAQAESDHAAELRAIKESYESQLNAANDHNNSLNFELEQSRTDLADVRGKLENAINQITDLEIERDNAVKESDALKTQVEDLRQQITEKPPIVSNLGGSAQLAEINARLLAKRIPVYDKKEEFRSQKGTFTTFKFAETGEPGEIIWTSFNAKYREVSADEAARFQQEAIEANQNIVESIQEVAPTEELDFRPETPELTTDASLPEHTPDGALDATTSEDVVTVEQRLAALEQAVFGKAKVAA